MASTRRGPPSSTALLKACRAVLVTWQGTTSSLDKTTGQLAVTRQQEQYPQQQEEVQVADYVLQIVKGQDVASCLLTFWER